MILDYDWEGYILNHLLLEDNPHYRDGDRFPADVNWKTQTRVPLVEKAIDLKFLWVAKLFYLAHDPDTEEELSVPIPVVLERYDYGLWQANIPEKQDKRVYFYQGIWDGENYILTLDEMRSRFIPRNRNTITERELVTVHRREFALNFLKGRAKEIDILTNFELGLETNIQTFFDTFDTEIRAYLNYGSTNILVVLNDVLDSWLNVELPDLGTIRAELIRVLSEALEIPTTEQIEGEIATNL